MRWCFMIGWHPRLMVCFVADIIISLHLGIIDDTPKGVTIHRVALRLDTGDIIYQKET